jgi:putative membrane protein
VRTGIAIIAFGFVIEKFHLVAAQVPQLERLGGSLGRGAGQTFVVVGIVFILVAAFRFWRTGRLLNDKEAHSAGTLVELILSAMLALLFAAISAYFFLLG